MELYLKPSDVEVISKFIRDRNYCWTGFAALGVRRAFVLEGPFGEQLMMGKLNESEGDCSRWPSFKRRYFIQRIETSSICLSNSIVCFPLTGKTLKESIRDVGFLEHPRCFERKKSYARDILRGLSYLHGKGMSLLNLTEDNVLVCKETDRAIICDFGSVTSETRVQKHSIPTSQLPLIPPETSGAVDGDVESQAIDLWCCGVIFLHMFSGEPSDVGFQKGFVRKFRTEINFGFYSDSRSYERLEEFLCLFLVADPKRRMPAKQALWSPFFKRSSRRLDEPARSFWKQRDFPEGLIRFAENGDEENTPFAESFFSVESATTLNSHESVPGACIPFKCSKRTLQGYDYEGSQKGSEKIELTRAGSHIYEELPDLPDPANPNYFDLAPWFGDFKKNRRRYGSSVLSCASQYSTESKFSKEKNIDDTKNLDAMSSGVIFVRPPKATSELHRYLTERAQSKQSVRNKPCSAHSFKTDVKMRRKRRDEKARQEKPSIIGQEVTKYRSEQTRALMGEIVKGPRSKTKTGDKTFEKKASLDLNRIVDYDMNIPLCKKSANKKLNKGKVLGCFRSVSNNSKSI